jgi:hypothetical protein
MLPSGALFMVDFLPLLQVFTVPLGSPRKNALPYLSGVSVTKKKCFLVLILGDLGCDHHVLPLVSPETEKVLV